MTLSERAAICRRIAEDHRRIAAHTIALADQMDQDAAWLDVGVDPFICNVCGSRASRGKRFRCPEHEEE